MIDFKMAGLEETTMSEAREILEEKIGRAKTAQLYCLDKSIILYMKRCHVLFGWLVNTGLAEYVQNQENMPLLAPFWIQLEKLGYVFTDDERQDLLQDWLDD
jgi:hypothetical protein